MDVKLLMNRYQVAALLVSLFLDKKLSLSSYKSSKEWISLVSKLSLLMDMILVSSQKKRDIYIGQCRRILENILLRDINRNLIILDSVLKSDGYELKDQPRSSIIIGICVDITLRLQPDGNAISQPVIESILKLIVQGMISSKTPVPEHYITPLASYCKRYITPEIYKAKKIENFDKWMLRSPEVVLKVINEITKHVSFDVGAYFSGKFCSGLLTQLKSKNEDIRNDAISFYKTLVKKSEERKALVEVTDIVLGFIPGATSDVRPYYYQALELISSGPVVSLKITRYILY